MTVYTWRDEWMPQTMALALEGNNRLHTSPFTQGVQVVDLLGERWRLSMTLPERRPQHGAALEAFFARLRGSAHEVALWHFRRPVPRGTLRGTPFVGATAAHGASTISLTGAGAHATLLAGDLIGAAGLLLMVAEDTTADASGAMTVTLANRLRTPVVLGTAVTWHQPTARFRLTGNGVPLGYRPGAMQPLELEFLESWA